MDPYDRADVMVGRRGHPAIAAVVFPVAGELVLVVVAPLIGWVSVVGLVLVFILAGAIAWV